MPRMTETELLNLLEAEERQSQGGGEGGDLQSRRAKNIRYYLDGRLGDEDDNHSQVVINTTAEVVDNMLPSMLRMFASRDNAVMFDPVGPEDMDGAKQETKAVQHTFWKKNRGYVILHNWLKDGMREINGVIACHFDHSEMVTQESYENLSIDEVVALEADGLVPIQQDIKSDFAASLQEDGTVTFEEQDVWDITFERTETKGRIVVENIRPEYFRISSDSTSPVIEQTVRFVGEYQYPTRQDLIDFGVNRDLVMSLTPIEADLRDLSEQGRARDQANKTARQPIMIHPLNQRIRWWITTVTVGWSADSA